MPSPILHSFTKTPNTMRAFEVLCAFPHGLGETDFVIDCSRKNDRVTDDEVEANIETIWKERTKCNPSIFNGSKFRFHHVQRASQENASMHVLSLGITDYKSFLGTNCSARWESIQESQLASPLGNAAIVETNDHMVVLLQRSGNVGECPHTIVMPGGHPEPEMIGIKSLADWNDRKEVETNNYKQFERSIATEMFDSMVREVVEETGIPREKLGKALCLGFSRRVQNHRPDIIFYISCNLSSDEVRQHYSNGVEHAFESTELMLMQRDDLVKNVLIEDSINMPGCLRGGIELFRQYLVAQSKV